MLRRCLLAVLCVVGVAASTFADSITYFSVQGSHSTVFNGINDAGQIVGSFDGGGFFYPGNGNAAGVVGVPGASAAIPTGINDQGQLAGYASIGTWIASPGGVFTTFQIPGSAFTLIRGINDNGVTVGNFSTGTSNPGFIRNPDGTFVSFEVPGGQPSPGFLPDTIVTAINDSGEAIGILRATPSIDHGFLRDASGNITVFDVPGALEDTDPLGINNAGQIVGAYRDPNGSGQFFGFLRNPDGTFVDFALPSCPFLSPTDINNLGQIVGYCGPGNQFGFLATADDFLPPTGELVGPALPPANIIITPEPSSFVLLMVCISVLAICVKQNLICTIR